MNHSNTIVNAKLKNLTKDEIHLPWGRFRYSLAPNETKALPANVVRAMLRRFPGKVKPVGSEAESLAPTPPVAGEKTDQPTVPAAGA